MRIFAYIYTILVALFASPQLLNAQNAEWRNIHLGNRAFKAKQYQTAANFYKKALTVNPSNERAIFNLGNVAFAQGNDSLAVSLYNEVAQKGKSSKVRATAAHNAGTVFQAQAGQATDPQAKQQFLRKAIESYKAALRQMPDNDGTRYNLVLCQKQLKDSEENNQQKQKQNQQQKQKQQKQNQQEQQNQQQKQNNQPLINYVKKSEEQTRRKLQTQPSTRSLNKNW